jgi:hypothetical protein
LSIRLAALLALYLFLASALVQARSFGDLLQNAFDQRQGNYDFQLKTEPSKLVDHSPTKIILRVGSVDGTDIVDLPITLRIVDSDGNVLQKTNPILVTGGHFIYEYTFEKPGTYAVYADINDYSYSGQTLTFTFLLNVGSPYDFLYLVVPLAATAITGVLITRRVVKRKSAYRADKI